MKHFIYLIIITFAMLVVGCKKEKITMDTTGSMPSKLIKTWKSVLINGNSTETNNTVILQIVNNRELNIFERVVYDTTPVWQDMSATAIYKEDTLRIYGAISYPFTQIVMTYKIIDLTDNLLRVKLLSKTVNGKYNPDNTIGQETLFEESSIALGGKMEGMWKADTKEGEIETFGYYFYSNNTFDYFYYNQQDIPTIKSDNEGYYKFYGNFLVLRYKNTPYQHDEQEFVDCWNVKIIEAIDETIPKAITFSALRKNGKTETISFKYLGKQL